MAEPLHLFTRLTHRFVGTYKHEDAHRYVGRAKLLPMRTLREPRENDFSDGGTYIARAVLPRGVSREVAMRALRDTLTSEGCAHEWDCCGCRSQWASVKPASNSRREAVVRLHVSFNY